MVHRNCRCCGAMDDKSWLAGLPAELALSPQQGAGRWGTAAEACVLEQAIDWAPRSGNEMSDGRQANQ